MFQMDAISGHCHRPVLLQHTFGHEAWESKVLELYVGTDNNIFGLDEALRRHDRTDLWEAVSALLNLRLFVVYAWLTAPLVSLFSLL